MKMKFFERTYLLTLMLFLLFLDVCAVFLCVFTYKSNIDATEGACASESFAITKSYENDIKELSLESAYIIQVSYCNFYRDKNVYLRFEENGSESFSTVPDGLEFPKEGYISSDKSNGKYYVLITNATNDGIYKITYVKDITDVYDKYMGIALWTIGASAAVSLCLAAILFFLLRKLHTPLNKLKEATEQISNGDLTARADESGNDELSYLARDFNRMALKVSEQIEELRSVADQRQRMLDDLAHEMRTPLTVIHGYAEYAGGANIPRDEQIEALEYIKKEAMRLKGISEILLDSAFIREGIVIRERIGVNDIVSGVVERFKLIADEKSVCICTGNLPSESIYVDKTLIELVLSNLTDNAINACCQDGRVELGCLSDSEYVTLYVRDNGIGMTSDQLKHIKEPFYRADKSRSRKRGGTGLGLALCEVIAIAHDATLDFESCEGKGTLAYIKLKKIYNSITNQ